MGYFLMSFNNPMVQQTVGANLPTWRVGVEYNDTPPKLEA